MQYTGVYHPCHTTARKWAQIRRLRGLESIRHVLRFAWGDLRNRRLNEIRKKRGWKQPELLKFGAARKI